MGSGDAAPLVARPGTADRVATLVATGFGCGYAPVAPGTVGSLLGLAMFWPLAQLPTGAQLAALAALVLLGAATGALVARRLAVKDPSVVVVDEVAGMWVSLLFLPLTPVTAAAGFFLFRVMDVAKPFPARSFERLRGGWGIMADDLMAGVYANLALRLLLVVWRAA